MSTPLQQQPQDQPLHQEQTPKPKKFHHHFQQQGGKKNTEQTASANDNNNKQSISAAAATTSTPSTTPPPPQATHVCVHLALATRVPKENGGGIMSIGAVCFNPETRVIVATFERNVLPTTTTTTTTTNLPLSCAFSGDITSQRLDEYRQSFLVGQNVRSSFPNIMNPDTSGYWGSSTRRKEYRAVTDNAVHPLDMMKDFHDFCKKHGGSRITLVCNPLGAFFSFILHYQEQFLMTAAAGKEYQNPPWGFGALCVRSYCSAALANVPLSQVANNKTYIEDWCEGFDPNQTLQPIASAVVGAIAFTNAFTFVSRSNSKISGSGSGSVDNDDVKNTNEEQEDKKQPPQSAAPTTGPVKWLCAIPAAAAKGYQVPDPVSDVFKMPTFIPETKSQHHNGGGRDHNHNHKHGNVNKQQQQSRPEQEKQQHEQARAPAPAPATATSSASDQKQKQEPPQLLLYPSITDADFSVDDIEKSVAVWASEQHPEIDWIAQEKVHGSNLSIAFDANSSSSSPNIYAARREAPLSLKDASAFYSFDYLIQDIRADLMKVVDGIKKQFASGGNGVGDGGGGDDEQKHTQRQLILVQFFGEICGGDYDDKERVSPVLGAAKVQRGVMYAPWHCFYVFDCVIHFQDKNRSEQVARYLSYDELDKFFTCALDCPPTASSCSAVNVDDNNSVNRNDNKKTKLKQLLLAPVLARGSFDELNKSVSCEFESRFSSWVGLPSRAMAASATTFIDEQQKANQGETNESSKVIQKKNFAEGLILRPVRSAQGAKAGQNDDGEKLFPLSVLSNSTSFISSLSTPTSNNNNNNDYYYYRPLVKKKHPLFREFVTSSQQQHLFANVAPNQLFSRMVTVARVASVISKMTKTERENEAKVVASMIADVMKDVKEVLKNRVAAAANNKKDTSANEDDDVDGDRRDNVVSVAFDEQAAAQDEVNRNLVSTAVRSYFGSS